jgi:hypothetical protein
MDVSEVLAASIIGIIALMMEASINFYQTTRRNNPEDSHLRTENEFYNSPVVTPGYHTQ